MSSIFGQKLTTIQQQSILDRMITKLLKTLGFTDKEIKIYLLILKYKKITPANLARGSSINRATVYAIAKSLVAKGVVIEDLGGKSLYLLPASPEALKKLNRKDEQEMKRRTQAIEALMQELALAQVGVEYPVSKIRFIEEGGIEDYLRDNLKNWIESMQKYDKTWWGFQDHSFAECYRAWIDWSWKHTPQEIELKLLSNKSAIEEQLRGKYPKRQIKFWNKSDKFTASTWIMGEYIVMIITNDKPFYLVQIHDAVMAHNQREIFKNLWNLV